MEELENEKKDKGQSKVVFFVMWVIATIALVAIVWNVRWAIVHHKTVDKLEAAYNEVHKQADVDLETKFTSDAFANETKPQNVEDFTQEAQ